MKRLTLLTIIMFAVSSPSFAAGRTYQGVIPSANANLYSILYSCRADVDPGVACSNTGGIALNASCVMMFCGGAQWNYAKSVWTQLGDNVYFSDITPLDNFVGINTTNPVFKLQLDGDGAVLAKGAVASGADVPDLGAGTRFMWIPKKGALRAGYVAGTRWDNLQVGTNSYAFGYDNEAAANYSSVTGGASNVINSNAAYSFIGGGGGNSIVGLDGPGFSEASVIVGGQNNRIDKLRSFIGGGSSNLIDGSNNHAIIGGENNRIYGIAGWHFIGGGGGNQVTGLAGGVVVGGTENHVNAGAGWATIIGGNDNLINAGDSSGSTIIGGTHHAVVGQYNFIGGGTQNTITNYGSGIGGGIQNSIDTVTGDGGNVIVGGYLNQAYGTTNWSTGGGHATIIGGRDNRATGNYSFVGGGGGSLGTGNNATGVASAIIGGSENSATADYAAIGGGRGNGARATHATVIGGGASVANLNQALGVASTVLGGWENQATIDNAVVLGGSSNIASTGFHPIAAGNTNQARGYASNATVGENNIIDGAHAWVGGQNMGAQGNSSFSFGTYLIPENTATQSVNFGFHGAGLNLSQPNVFLIPTGEVGLGPSATDPGAGLYRLEVDGHMEVTVGDIYLGGLPLSDSDIRLKTDVAPIENSLERIKMLRGVSYTMKDRSETHIGLIAQNVEEAFPSTVVENKKGIKAVDYSRLVAPLIEAVKEIDRKTSELENRLSHVEKDHQSIQNSVD